MVINIITGNKFPQKKLLSETNIFFNSPKRSSLITSRSSPYIIKIGKKSIKILLSRQCEKDDYHKIKTFIKTIFNGTSILIVSNEDIHWLDDIDNVKIDTLHI